MSYILETNNLCKSYSGIETVSNVNIKIKKGEIYGFLGPNGAGKTTVMRMITNLIKPTSGTIKIFGEEITSKSYEPLKRIGSLIEYPIFYENLTAKDNLDIHCEYMGIYDKTVVDKSLKLVNLTNIDNKLVKNYSLGMKQRLGIARALCTNPEILILDEPVNGLDPIGIHELRELFYKLSKENGITILISSHILQEIEHLADTIGVINHGRLIKEISMNSLINSHSEYIQVVTNDVNKAAFILENKLKLTKFKVIDHKIIRIYDSQVSSRDISKILILNNVDVEELLKRNISLEQYFLQIINTGKMMYKLIKLEIRRIDFSKYLIGALAINLILLLWLVTSEGGRLPEGYTNFEQAFSDIGTYSRVIFLIFSGVILSRLIIDEYKNKTISILFSYPIPRKKILISKLILLSFLTFSMILISNIFIAVMFLIANHIFNIVPDILTTEIIYTEFIRCIIFTFAATGISLIPFFFGMLKKSVPSTIVASFIVSQLYMLTMNRYSIYTSSLLSTLAALIWITIGITLCYLSINKIETRDVTYS